MSLLLYSIIYELNCSLIFSYFNFDGLDRDKEGFKNFNKGKKFLGGKSLAFFDGFSVGMFDFKVGKVLEFKDSISS